MFKVLFQSATAFSEPVAYEEVLVPGDSLEIWAGGDLVVRDGTKVQSAFNRVIWISAARVEDVEA